MKIERLGEFRVLSLRECPVELGRRCDTPEGAADYWTANIAPDPRFSPDCETIWGLCLSTRRLVFGCYLIATGTLDTMLCDPRAVFRPPIIANASAIILMHNHPSGDPTPSEADVKITRELIRGGQLLKIELLDHVIMGAVTPDRVRPWVSLRELGYFYT